tara:strand:+ start:4313 stop:4987 length:675 start_codon:yes stop_codon:yes gene_type:complete
MPNTLPYRAIGRTVNVAGSPIGGNGPITTAYTSEYPKGIGATLYVANMAVPVPGVNSEVTAVLETSAGFGNGEFLRSQIGPGSAVKFRFSTQVNLSVQQQQTFGPGLARPATTVYLWTDFDKLDIPSPPITSLLRVPAGAFLNIAPNAGFAPPYKPWVNINASAPYDIEFRGSDGTLLFLYTNILPGNRNTNTFLLPMGARIAIRPNGAAPIVASATWTETEGN